MIINPEDYQITDEEREAFVKIFVNIIIEHEETESFYEYVDCYAQDLLMKMVQDEKNAYLIYENIKDDVRAKAAMIQNNRCPIEDIHIANIIGDVLYKRLIFADKF